MAPKAILETLDGVPEALHEHYTQTDEGKFRPVLRGIACPWHQVIHPRGPLACGSIPRCQPPALSG